MRRDTCRNKMADILDNELFNACLEFMVRIKQARYMKNAKFDRLQHMYHGQFHPYSSPINGCVHNSNNYVRNNENNTYNDNGNSNENNNDINNSNHRGERNINIINRWIINMSSTSIIEAQRTLLARVSNFMVAPRYPIKRRIYSSSREGVPMSSSGQQQY